MRIELDLKEAPSLYRKGIRYIVVVRHETLQLDGISRVNEYVKKIAETLESKYGFKISKIEFTGNEDIGSRYILYRFRLYVDDKYIGCRIVTFLNRHKQTILTVGEGLI